MNDFLDYENDDPLCSIELSLLAKTRGFRWKTRYGAHEQKTGLPPYKKWAQDKSWFLYVYPLNEEKYNNHVIQLTHIPIPTLCQLQRWLLKKHGINVEITRYKNSWSYDSYKFIDAVDLVSAFNFDSPEEALEAGLMSTLKTFTINYD